MTDNINYGRDAIGRRYVKAFTHRDHAAKAREYLREADRHADHPGHAGALMSAAAAHASLALYELNRPKDTNPVVGRLKYDDGGHVTGTHGEARP